VIRARITEGNLPPGERVSDFLLAKEIGISRTPVREAIMQLASEGLIEHIPQLGSFVRTLTRDELVELFDLREMLESYAASMAALRITPVVTDKLRAISDEMAGLIAQIEREEAGDLYGDLLRRQVKEDMRFHLLILRASNCRQVIRVVSDMRVLTNLFLHKRRAPSAKALAHLKMVLEEHIGIVDALALHDAEQVAERMRIHLRRSKEVALAYYDAHANEDILLNLDGRE